MTGPVATPFDSIFPMVLIFGSAAVGAITLAVSAAALERSHRRTATGREISKAGAMAGAALVASLIFAGLWAMFLVSTRGYLLYQPEPWLIGPLTLELLGIAAAVWAVGATSRARAARRIEEQWVGAITKETQTTYFTWGSSVPGSPQAGLPQLPGSACESLDPNRF